VTLYAKCPNGCSGEVPMELEGQGGYDDPYVVGIDDDANATSHDEGCLPLTEAQRETLEANADVADYLEAEAEAWAEAWAEVGL
jgi:hypothetical protein